MARPRNDRVVSAARVQSYLDLHDDRAAEAKRLYHWAREQGIPTEGLNLFLLALDDRRDELLAKLGRLTGGPIVWSEFDEPDIEKSGDDCALRPIKATSLITGCENVLHLEDW